METGRRAAAQVALAVALTVAAAPARAYLPFAPDGRLPCAGDGQPTKKLELSALLSLAITPYAGGSVDPLAGDPVDQARFNLLAARVAMCGKMPLRFGTLFYHAGWEPYAAAERARPDASAWGRFTALEVGYAPWRWLTIWAGVHKVAFSFAHDQPEATLPLPFRPALASSVAPDRRFGLTVDLALGAARFIAGVYEGNRDLSETPWLGLLLTARAIFEPFGPVGPSLSTRDDSPFWRRRPRVGVGVSALYEWNDLPNLTVYAVGGDLALKWGPAALAVEYLYDHYSLVESPTPLPAPRILRQGLWAELALMVLRPVLELDARYEWLDEPDVPRERYHALTAGLTAYVRGVARVQAVYSHKFHRRGRFEDDLFLLALTLAR